MAETFVPIPSPSDFTHRSVISPVSYNEYVNVKDRVPNGLAAPTMTSSSSQAYDGDGSGGHIMTIQQQRLHALRQNLSDLDESSRTLLLKNINRPAIRFEEVILSQYKKNGSTKSFPSSHNKTQYEDFRPSEPAFPQGIHNNYYSNRRDFGVSVNPILSPYSNRHNEIQSVSTNLLSNGYELSDNESPVISDGEFGITVEPMTMSQVLQQQSQRRPNNIQYIINTKPQGNEDVQFIIHDEDDYKAESSQTVYTPPKIAHPALIKWESSPEATPQVPTTEIKYAQHIDALQYFPPSTPQPNLKIKPLKEKIQKSPIPNLSLMFLGKHGPSFPVFTSMMKDLHHAMERMVGNPLEIFNGQPSSILTTMRTFLNNFSVGSYGDNKLDIFDFIPLLAVLVASVLIFAGTFPNGVNILGLNQSTLPLGRRVDEETMFETALNQLESGVMMISAIRHEDSCSAKLACKLGDAAKDSFPNKDMLLGAVNLLLGERFVKFSESFEDVLEGRDRSSCEEKCTRCMAI